MSAWTERAPWRLRLAPPGALGLALLLLPLCVLPAAAAQAPDLSPALRLWARAAHQHAERCERFNAATVALWDQLEPIASSDTAWLPDALNLFEHYPGLSPSQQAMHRALMHDAPPNHEEVAYELDACSPSAFVYGVRRILSHLSFLPGERALRQRTTLLVLHKALHDLAQPCPPFTLLAHLTLVGELQRASLLNARRHVALLEAAHHEIAVSLQALGFEGEFGQEGPLGQGPAHELNQLDCGRKLLLQLVAEELLP